MEREKDNKILNLHCQRPSDLGHVRAEKVGWFDYLYIQIVSTLVVHDGECLILGTIKAVPDVLRRSRATEDRIDEPETAHGVTDDSDV